MAKFDLSDIAVELDAEEVKLISYVLENNFTMTSVARLVNTLKSCKYAVQNNIPGDFVECGVWRGGHGILAKKIFERMGSSKKVWMFDTFEGMAEPVLTLLAHYLMYSFRTPLRLGCLSLRNALASI